MIPQELLDKVTKCATKSRHKTYKHAAAIISNRGKLICIANNGPFGVHAEARALSKYFKFHHPNGARIGYMIVLRITRGGTKFAVSIPCFDCMNYLTKLQISWITPLGPKNEYQLIRSN